MADNIKYMYDSEHQIVYPKTIVAAIDDFKTEVIRTTSTISQLVTQDQLTSTLSGYVTRSDYNENISSLSNNFSNYITTSAFPDLWVDEWNRMQETLTGSVGNIIREDIRDVYGVKLTFLQERIEAVNERIDRYHPETIVPNATKAMPNEGLVIEDVQPYIEEIVSPLIENLSNEISKTNSAISSLSAELPTDDSKIDELTKTVNNLEKSINSLESDMGDINSTIQEVTDEVLAHRSSIHLLSDMIDNISEEIKNKPVSNDTIGLFIDAVNGNDDNDGFDANRAYKTLQRAVEEALTHPTNDIVFSLYGGNYVMPISKVSNVNWTLQNVDDFGVVRISLQGKFTILNSLLDLNAITFINGDIESYNTALSLKDINAINLVTNGGNLSTSGQCAFSLIRSNGTMVFLDGKLILSGMSPMAFYKGSIVRLCTLPEFTYSYGKLDYAVYMSQSTLYISSDVKNELTEKHEYLPAYGAFPKQGFCQIITD